MFNLNICFLNLKMYLLIINRNKFHIFSSEENIETWLNEYYHQEIIPDYEIIQFDKIDPESDEEPFELMMKNFTTNYYDY